MPVKKRHQIYDLGAVTAPGTSISVNLEPFTKMMLYLEGVGAVVAPEFSWDGVNWYAMHRESDGLAFTVTVGALPEVHGILTCPMYFRVGVITADLTDCRVEGIREIA